MTLARLDVIEKVFHAALGCEPEELGEFLDTTCAGDDGLRREVETLLASHRQTEDSVEISIKAVAASVVTNRQADSLIGQTIGHYQIRERIGRGGMGEVYLAYDVIAGREAALKLLPAHLTGDGARLKRFEQEAHAVASFNHPNIVTIYEVGTHNSTRYIASELIQGETLRQRLARGRMDIKEAVEIAAQIATALAAAHSTGVVHRDIKPENIMLRPDGYVKVLDFGIAKLAESAFAERRMGGTEPVTLAETNAGSVLGTVGYMSPEQASGSRQIDHRTDIWSLGVVFYEMATGRAPFAGYAPAEVLRAILKNEPHAVRPTELQQIVSKTLNKRADDRYQTANQLLQALRALQRKLELSSERERVAATQAWLNRTSSRIVLAVLLVVAAVVGTLTLRWLRNPTIIPTPEKSIAVLPFEYLSSDKTDAYLADGIQEEILRRLSRIADLKVISRGSTEVYKGGQPPNLRQIGEQLGVANVLEGSVEKTGDQMRVNVELVNAHNNSNLWADKYDRTLADIFAVETEIAIKITDALQAKLTGAEQRAISSRPTANSEAHEMYLKGVYYWSKSLVPVIEKSRDHFQRAIDLDPNYGPAYAGLADDYGFAAANGLMAPAEGWPKAEAAANKALQIDETLSEPYNIIAAIKLYRDRDWSAAEQTFHRGIELDPNFAEIHVHYAMCLMLFGRDNDAIKEIRRAVELDPVSLRYNAGWGKILFYLRQYDRAIEQFQRTLELDPNYPVAHKWLGDVYEKRGMPREAIVEWSKALALSGEDSSILDDAYANSGFEAAVEALAQRQVDRFNEKVARGQYVAAGEFVTAYTRLGDKEQALAWLSKAVEEHNRFALEVKIDPVLDPLRGDPRFEKIVATVTPNGN